MGEVIFYEIENKQFKGYLSFPKSEEKRAQHFPTVIVAHAWMGQDQFARHKADQLAQLGYIGFAVDLYGEGKTAKNSDEAQQLMIPLFENRTLLQQRIKGAFDFIKQYPGVDSERIGAIGFCFGGLTVLELLRSGTPVKGVVSFHGALSNQRGEIKAKTVPISKKINGSLLILHGYEDPLVSQSDISNLQIELNNAGVDWQMNIYGHTSHAFTNPEAHDTKNGMIYNSQTSERAWWSMIHFFSDLFGLTKKLQSY